MNTIISGLLCFYIFIFSFLNLFAQPGQIDSSFQIGNSAGGTANIIEILPNGKIIVGGDFTSFNGLTVQRIVRLNQDGTHDMSFPHYSAQGGVEGPIRSSELQPDGKLIIGGLFNTVYGIPLKNIARLDSNGLPDPTFQIGTGANNEVLSISSNGSRILLAGFFSNWNGVTVPNMVCILPDGSIDQSFVLPSQLSVFVNDVHLLLNGKSYIAGGFTSYNGSSVNRLVKLNYNGSIDTSFNIGSGFNAVINRLAIQNDGKLIVVGNFTSVNGLTFNRIARLNIDGSIDAGFNPGSAANGAIRSVSIQSDGKIIIGGDFTTFNGVLVNRIARLLSDGTLDNSFIQGSGTNGTILSSKIQTDGKVLICGTFTTYNNVSKRRFLRLENDICLNDNQSPLPLISNLPVLNAVCNANISNIPQAIDNCAGLLTATTINPLIYNQPGIYTINWIYNDNNNNTSMQTQQLVIAAINADFSVDTLPSNSYQLRANQIINNYNYRWINCSNNSIVSDSSIFIPQTSGSYALIVDYGTCSDTSACVQVNMISLATNLNYVKNEVVVFPNPVNDKIEMYFELNTLNLVDVSVYNSLGSMVYSSVISNTSLGRNYLKIDASSFRNGIYFLSIKTGKDNLVKKLIIDK